VIDTLGNRMQTSHVILPILLAAACSNAVPADSLIYISKYALRVDFAGTMRPREPGYGELSEADATSFRALHARTAAVVGSRSFETLLYDVDALLAKAGADPISGRRFAAIYLGLDRSYEWPHLCYYFEPGGGSEAARSGLSAVRSTCNPDGKTVVNTTLRSVTRDRALSKIVEANACAVNTLAHEWSHAITVTDVHNGHHMVFEDDDHDHQRGAVASYVVGAFAQCLYLAGASGDSDQFEVRRCVEAVGTNGFNPATCEAGWARQFHTETRA
jgi:hypothetical protein